MEISTGMGEYPVEKTHNPNNEEMVIDLVQLAKALWRRAWAILLAMVVFGGAAFSYAYFIITPLYKASAMLYVNNSSLSVGSTKVDLSDLNAAQSLVDTYIVILKTRTTLEEVIETAGLSYDYETLSKMIEAGAVNSTEVFSIEVTSPDPAEAERIANTIAELLPDRIAEIVDGSSVRIVDYAVVPSQKSSPSISRYTLLGLLLGAVVSCGVIVLLYLFDDQIRDEEYVRQTFDLPLLAAIPDLTGRNSGSSYYYSKKTSGKEATP